ncbi:MAG: squalene/phytoene synthase family protein [Rubritalea sp.]|uniref:phytoene/squalene synthase family protein n=1 Tax=Rubritalea sp. TaxID=2109375 RepID=UPI00324295EF
MAIREIRGEKLQALCFHSGVQKEIDLGKGVLKGVSRSFYLTIRFLPRLMREPISLGYLLARASDTIADTEQVPAALRETCLAKFTPALTDKVVRAELIELISSSFVSYQTNAKERLLLERLDDVFHWYDTVREWAWSAIAVVLGHICTGQMNDIRHFAINHHTSFSSAKELETYCYQVAGSVGEFWSEVGYQSAHRFSRLERSVLDETGGEYGIGLQLVNILRDIPEDFANGRCYLPVSDPQSKEQIMEAAKDWRAQARAYLDSGITYAKSLRKWRVRVATILPALIAQETLDLLDHASWEDLERGIKVDRATVKRCFRKALFY